MMMNLQQGLHEKFSKVEQYCFASENRLKLLSRLWISRMVKSRAYEGRVQPVHRYGARKATKGPGAVNL
jgi:hypothetical protein